MASLVSDFPLRWTRLASLPDLARAEPSHEKLFVSPLVFSGGQETTYRKRVEVSPSRVSDWPGMSELQLTAVSVVAYNVYQDEHASTRRVETASICFSFYVFR